MVSRRKYLSTAVFMAGSVGISGCIDLNENETSFDAIAEWNYRVYDRVRFPGQSEDEYFESDEESTYVGVQLLLTNVTGDGRVFVTPNTLSTPEGPIEGPELKLVADVGTVYIHSKSRTSDLREIDRGVTAEATLLYVCHPDASDYSFENFYRSDTKYEIIRNEDLEIDLISVNEPS